VASPAPIDFFFHTGKVKMFIHIVKNIIFLWLW
jgi:hypothetical protein